MSNDRHKRPHGGHREGAGRPAGERTQNLHVRITEKAHGYLCKMTHNKGEFVDWLIRKEYESDM